MTCCRARQLPANGFPAPDYIAFAIFEFSCGSFQSENSHSACQVLEGNIISVLFMTSIKCMESSLCMLVRNIKKEAGMKASLLVGLTMLSVQVWGAFCQFSGTLALRNSTHSESWAPAPARKNKNDKHLEGNPERNGLCYLVYGQHRR